jgi:hypothetical protein
MKAWDSLKALLSNSIGNSDGRFAQAQGHKRCKLRTEGLSTMAAGFYEVSDGFRTTQILELKVEKKLSDLQPCQRQSHQYQLVAMLTVVIKLIIM